MKPIASILAAAMLAAIGAGCQTKYTQPVGPPPPPQSPAERSFSSYWEAARYVLTDYDFTIDRHDRRSGVISTMPLLGRSWFEFWRKDSTSWNRLVESSNQKIYYIATVTIAPVPGKADEFQPSVRVDVARSDLPDVMITSTGDAYELFLGAGSRAKWVAGVGKPDEAEPAAGQAIKAASQPASAASATTKPKPQYPLPPNQVYLGRDVQLETKINSAIVRKAYSFRTTSPSQQPAVTWE